ncbi:hypothetical protein L3Q82_015746, partial [Scortum barcoo]
VLAELKKSNFTLLNRSIQFDENGDPKYGSYSVVFWNQSGDAEEIGFYHFRPSFNFFIDNSKIQWHTKDKVPTSICSPECPEGYKKKYSGIHECCFTCQICENGTYVNKTEDHYKCISCKETEWSAEGSTSCKLRVVEYIPFTDCWAILIMIGAWTLDENRIVPPESEGRLSAKFSSPVPWRETTPSPFRAEPGRVPWAKTRPPAKATQCDVQMKENVSYGAAASAFTEKLKFPSFLRTVHSSKAIIEVLVNILLHFNWRWVAFLNSDNYFGKNGLKMFIRRIKDTAIYLAYTKGLSENANYQQVFKQIEVSLIHALAQCTVPASEFKLDGDYLMGGLFDIHHVNVPVYHERPEPIHCSSQPFLLPNYRRFQLMRFSVEEINNSTNLLPNVPLGYEIFDYCSNIQNFPGILDLISVDGLIQPWAELRKQQTHKSSVSKVIAVVGPFTSTQALTVAPLFMADLIPMVSYGSSSSVFSTNVKFPSFLRTVHSNKATVEVIVNILLHFNWRWVAFLNSDNDFGKDGLELFIDRIKDTEICLAYTKSLSDITSYSQVFKQIEVQKVKTIIVVAPKLTAEAVIMSAIQLNVTGKVWIADDGWSLNERLPKEKGIRNIGTVLGVSQPVVTIPGFRDFIYSTKSQTHCGNVKQKTFCNQVCNCSSLSPEDILDEDPSFSFPVYAAVYAIAHALHNALQCGAGRCNGNITVYPHMVPTSLCSPECPVGYAKKLNGNNKCCFTCEICPNGTHVNSTASEFKLQGDYLLGGLFYIHYVNVPDSFDRPEAIDCSSQIFVMSNYRRFQLMRFSVEEINNSTSLLPNVSLGYEIFDHCTNAQNFPGILDLISVNGLIQPWAELHKQQTQKSSVSKVIAVVGPFTSSHALSVAPLFMADLIPMVNYGASSSVFSQRVKFPSFLRTVHSSTQVIEVIVNILLHFNWRWVAFLYSDNDTGNNGQELFINRIKDTEICLAYTKSLNDYTNYNQVFKQIEALKVKTIIVFAPELTAEAAIMSAIQLNVTDKVWIGGDTWSLNERLPKEKGIRNIGTVLGVSQPVVTIPGFRDFIYSTKSQTHCGNVKQKTLCNQVCNCSSLSPEGIFDADPSFSFPVYAAVYAIAHALHNALQCGAGRCNDNITVYPSTILAELEKSNFTLLNRSIEFDKTGDPKSGSYNIVFWNRTGNAEEIGFYTFDTSVKFFINNTKIQWYMNGEVTTSLCSPDCPAGYAKELNGNHKCCFDCKICVNGTYVNSTVDPYRCISCKETEWSAEGSTSCNLRVVEYVSFTDSWAILIMIGAWTLVGLTVAMSVLFVINYNTPVVRSAGGPMCFLILGCLSLCNLSVFFYFGKPTISFCILRFLPFLLFYTVCLACFVVRSFQIVCIFKIAAKFPKLHSWWIKYHGQWLVITVAFVTQALLLLTGYSYSPSMPQNDLEWNTEKIILTCDLNLTAISASLFLLISLCSLCFIFSYMGKDLPKNYNEAKAITFCLLLLILTWIIFATVYRLYRGKYIQTLNALAVLLSLYSFLLWYFFPKCYIIIFQPHKNTQQYFQGLIQSYTKTISQ